MKMFILSPGQEYLLSRKESMKKHVKWFNVYTDRCIVQFGKKKIYTDFCLFFALLFIDLFQVLHQFAVIMNTTKYSPSLCRLIVMMLTLSQGIHLLPVPTDVPMCTASETAQYSLTFTGKWTVAAFPKQYPVYRPPAQWSNLIGKCTVA